MWYLHIRRHFKDVIFFLLIRRQYGRHVNFNYLPPKVKFGAFPLKLAHKMQESPDPDIQWTYRLNCTDTICAILMTPQ